MSACFTVTGSSWLIMSDIMVRLFRTTPSSVFSFFTCNINIIKSTNTASKYYIRGWRPSELTNRYKKELWGNIVKTRSWQEQSEIQTPLSSSITWLGVKALVPSRASLSSEVWGGMSWGWEDKRTAGKVVAAGPFPAAVWQAKAQKWQEREETQDMRQHPDD